MQIVLYNGCKMLVVVALVWESWCNGSGLPWSVSSGWTKEGWGQWAMLPGCRQCFQFQSLLWHSHFEEQEGQPVCHSVNDLLQLSL